MSIKTVIKSMLHTNTYARKVYYYLSNNCNDYIKKYRAMIDIHEITDKKLKSMMQHCLFSYGCVYDEFFMFGLYKKSEEERDSFITDCKRYKYYKVFNSKEDDSLLDDKWKTYLKFSKFYHREAILVKSPEDYASFTNFITKHPSFIVKKLSLSCGKGIEFFDDVTDKQCALIFENLIKSGPYIVEELIEQAEAIGILHAGSVNTIRINTILCSDKTQIVVFYPFLKIGIGKMRVDNGGAGGILCGIDKDTGVVRTCGVDELGKRYSTHPDTKVKFEGFLLPEWQKAVCMAKELQMLLPNHRCTGWDLAYSKNGWCLVEGNSGGQFIGQQMVDQVGHRAELESLL